MFRSFLQPDPLWNPFRSPFQSLKPLSSVGEQPQATLYFFFFFQTSIHRLLALSQKTARIIVNYTELAGGWCACVCVCVCVRVCMFILACVHV